ncbi:hypothetical protein Pfo_015595 [Paulownia fortunei]|nr:hypothetical protein Pfo_015595 [Paulownia fortunei]
MATIDRSQNAIGTAALVDMTNLSSIGWTSDIWALFARTKKSDFQLIHKKTQFSWIKYLFFICVRLDVGLQNKLITRCMIYVQ